MVLLWLLRGFCSSFKSLLALWNRFTRVPIFLVLLDFVIKLYVRHVHKPDGSVKRYSWMSKLKVPSDPRFLSFGVASIDAEVSSGNEDLAVRAFLPECLKRSNKKLPVCVYFHGGGFCHSTPADFMYDQFCRRIAASASCIVVSVGYRLAPETPFPAAYDDGMAVIHWLASEKPFEFADLKNTFLAGDSAGGNIAHYVSVCCLSEWLHPVVIRGRILLCPFFGGVDKLQSEREFRNGHVIDETISARMWKSFLPAGANLDHFASNPLVHQNRSLVAGLPPTLVQLDGLDYLHDRGLLFAEALRDAGVEVELIEYRDSIHDGALLGLKPERLMKDISEFIRRRTVPRHAGRQVT